MNTSTDLTVAKTILEQLGGSGRVMAMTGARSFIGSANSLSFRIPRFNHKGYVTTVMIVLDPSDTYTVTGLRGAKVVKSVSDVYCDQLISTVESITGLYLRL